MRLRTYVSSANNFQKSDTFPTKKGKQICAEKERLFERENLS